MIKVDAAQARLLALGSPLPAETLDLRDCIGRYLARDVAALRTQPAADLSAMDGYAIRFADMPGPWQLVGESAAGNPYSGIITNQNTARIFTGAHVPTGADTILVQEDTQFEGGRICLIGDGPAASGAHIRKMGSDFAEQQALLGKGQYLSAGPIAAAAMGGHGRLAVGAKPKIAIIGSGNELVSPGAPCNSAQIPSSNNIMLAAMLSQLPCDIIDHGIVRDTIEALTKAFVACADADIIVTSGGASVGDHDLIRPALTQAGADIDFWRVAMRPGKPVLAGRLGKTIIVGLPGNPSSAYVTAFLFLLPLVRHMAGCYDPLPKIFNGTVNVDLSANGSRVHYMRAVYDGGLVTPYDAQDSGMLTPLISANALIIRDVDAPPLRKGEALSYHMLFS